MVAPGRDRIGRLAGPSVAAGVVLVGLVLVVVIVVVGVVVCGWRVIVGFVRRTNGTARLSAPQ